jgi:hypothetical protein
MAQQRVRVSLNTAHEIVGKAHEFVKIRTRVERLLLGSAQASLRHHAHGAGDASDVLNPTYPTAYLA